MSEETDVDAVVRGQIARTADRQARFQVLRCSNDFQPHGRTYRHRNHVLGDLFLKANTRIEALGRNVSQRGIAHHRGTSAEKPPAPATGWLPRSMFAVGDADTTAGFVT
jgi:hypothetical protein